MRRLLRLAVFAVPAAIVSAQAPVAPQYGRDIRPILAERCFRCHGPDPATRAAELRLDERDAAIAPREHGAAIVPGDPARSRLLDRVRSSDPAFCMPPPDSRKPLLHAAEVELLERWIAGGAVYEPHWAFVPPTPQAVPEGSAANPVDAFLRVAQAEQGLRTAPAADAATQCRRLFLVLTGLPPTPEEQRAFADDHAAEDDHAYARWVDRLLGQDPYRQRHAEHLAGIWLDAGRYADTSGIHMDAGRQAWHWRDWLIGALRDDLPFDRFVVEQLAGDLLADADDAARTATGFLRNHVTTDEGGAIDAEYLVEYAAERTNTVGSVFLGLTLGCARCHDHKYDPISQSDYYRLFSFFFNNEEPGLYSQSKDPNRALEPAIAVPTAEQSARIAAIEASIAAIAATQRATSAAEQQAYRAFLAGVDAVPWSRPTVLAAQANGSEPQVQVDGSVVQGGANPDRDVLTVRLGSGGGRLRWLGITALPNVDREDRRVGRAPNGNAVLQHVRLEERPAGADDDAWQPVPLIAAYADVEQADGDYAAGNVLQDDGRGWAVAAHQHPGGPRSLALLAARTFGGDRGSELRVHLHYDSPYAQHSFARVAFALRAADDVELAHLPLVTSGLSVVGPFQAPAGELYERAFGPERATSIDREERFGTLRWRFDPALAPGKAHALTAGTNVHFIGQRVACPTDRRVELALGSDDGFRLFLDGRQVAERRVDRGVAPDQDVVAFQLSAGVHTLVLEVVNTGGASGFAWRHVPHVDEWHGDLQLAALPPAADAARADRIAEAWRTTFSPAHRERTARLQALRAELADLRTAVPQVMVMRERAEPRPTYVLMRGEYDKPDTNRPVQRELPTVFGALPAGEPHDRLGLARWLVSDRNPLLRRVLVNRLWEFVFGVGIVRTSEDFGLQGEWPSHPELLDWLALELRDRGHSVRAILRLLVTSHAFRQEAVRGPGATVDPDDRLLSWFPRRRLTAEAIRDQALYVAGLLVERPGGPSVKPYQPTGLWREVAMLQSNTRTFERDAGEALWRRSLYTYWKRACPPPSLLTFDAPTREFCTIRRATTNTPLQALVLWNDEQHVEAARMLAQRTLQASADDDSRLTSLFRRVAGDALSAAQRQRALAVLAVNRERFAAAPADATALLAIGEAPFDPALSPTELAAWTLLANALLSLDATIYLD